MTTGQNWGFCHCWIERAMNLRCAVYNSKISEFLLTLYTTGSVYKWSTWRRDKVVLSATTSPTFKVQGEHDRSEYVKTPAALCV